MGVTTPSLAVAVDRPLLKDTLTQKVVAAAAVEEGDVAEDVAGAGEEAATQLILTTSIHTTRRIMQAPVTHILMALLRLVIMRTDLALEVMATTAAATEVAMKVRKSKS